MFNFTPLLGARTSSQASQSLLQFDDGIKILVDVGWDTDFDPDQLKWLEKHIPTLSLILLTHATPAHVAAYAHCCKHFPLFLQIPVYATQPVASLTRTLLQDLYSSDPRASTTIPTPLLDGENTSGSGPQILRQAPSRDEIASYVQRIHPLKYSQPHEPTPSSFSPSLNGLTITAYNAGHSLGGTIWHILYGMESVVYAVDWNQVRENVYNRAAWLPSGGAAEIIEQLRKPTALICSTRGISKSPYAGGRNKRDELLLDMIRTALAKGGTVLVPTDSSARVLELAYIVEHAWRQHNDGSAEHPLQSAKAYLASKSIGTTMRYARSMLEWMDDGMAREAEADPSRADTGKGAPGSKYTPTGPFDFKHVKLVQSKLQIDKILLDAGPKVILASDTTLDWGFSRDVMVSIAHNPANLVLLTDDQSIAHPLQSKPGIGQTLWQWYTERMHGVAVEHGSDGHTFEQVYTGGTELAYQISTRTPLEGAELSVYQQHLATQKPHQDLEGMNDANLENGADVPDDAASASSSESEESDSDRQGKALNYSTAAGQAKRQSEAKAATGVNMLLKEPNIYDYDVRGKKGRESIFPTTVKRKRMDEFGEVIRPEDYLRAEEKDEMQTHETTLGSKDQETGQKRKWGDVDLVMQGSSGSGLKRRRSDDQGDEMPGDDQDELLETAETEEEFFPPSKLTTSDATVEVHLRIGFVDFTGLHDERNMSLLLPLIAPRKIILTGGPESDTLFLAKQCQQRLLQNDSDESSDAAQRVFTPSNGQTIEASMDTNAWTVRLSDALVRKLHWQTVGKLDVMTLAGRLAATLPLEPSETRVKRQRTIKAEEDESTTDAKQEELPPTLDIVPAHLAGGTRSVAQPLHVGDLRLADLRKILLSDGHKADFRGQGTLVVDGRVAVRKSTGGRIEIESSEGRGARVDVRRLETPFFAAVKQRIYEGLAVIGGR